MTLNKTVLVTGASGLLGREIIAECERKGWKAVGTALSRVDPPRVVKMDLEDTKAIAQVLDDVKPTAIIHTAADRSPDSVAADPKTGLATNVHATEQLAEEAAKRGIFTLYISTDYVFPGSLPSPKEDPDAVCRTTDKAHPINGYGLTKYKGEEAVLKATKDKTLENGAPIAAIMRVPLLYGHVQPDDPSRDGINKLVEELQNIAKSAVTSGNPHVTDFPADNILVRYPTWTGDVGRVCADVCDEYCQTTSDKAKLLPTRLQFASQIPFTRYDMAMKLCDILGYDQTPFARLLSKVESKIKATPGSPIRVVPDDSVKEQATQELAALTSDSVTEDQIMLSKARPIHTRLDISELKRIGINTDTAKFEDWWRRELAGSQK